MSHGAGNVSCECVCVCQSFYNGYELYRFSRMESGQWLLDGRLYQGEHAPRAYAPRAP